MNWLNKRRKKIFPPFFPKKAKLISGKLKELRWLIFSKQNNRKIMYWPWAEEHLVFTTTLI